MVSMKTITIVRNLSKAGIKRKSLELDGKVGKNQTRIDFEIEYSFVVNSSNRKEIEKLVSEKLGISSNYVKKHLNLTPSDKVL